MPHRGTSNEYPQHMFSWRYGINNLWISPLIWYYMYGVTDLFCYFAGDGRPSACELYISNHGKCIQFYAPKFEKFGVSIQLLLCSSFFWVRLSHFTLWTRVSENIWTRALALCSLETPKRVIGKQCRPRSDATECGIWSGSPMFANSSTIFL